MKHPFRVGGKYRNNDGEYEVIKLDDPKMVIRYVDGRQVTATISTQALAWSRIQDEDRLKVVIDDPPTRIRTGHSQAARGREFRGLQETDFKRGVVGTSWRARPSLGGLLAQTMSDATRRHFESYAIYRRADVHVAQPEYYREPPARKTETIEKSAGQREARVRYPKFAFILSEEHASFGFYIEKNDGPMDGTWHWLRFVNALKSDCDLQHKVQAAMRQQNLHWVVEIWPDEGPVAHVEAGQDGLQWISGNQNESEGITWAEFVAKLGAIDPSKWCDLFLLAQLDKAQAIALNVGITRPVTEVLLALLPLYDASVGHSRGSG
ncbi:MAG: hypothetical protein GXY76_19475 [Chloroflexi bacterium]|nr:hypothetical protein [Chloroflexota bacterium]